MHPPEGSSASVAGAPPAAAPVAGPHYRLRLWVAGSLPNSLQARENLGEICRKYLPGRHTLEVVDFLEHPRRALDEGIVATPTLVRLEPGPAATIVGTLSDRGTVLRALSLEE
jgi:circadian clock protein KaiB